MTGRGDPSLEPYASGSILDFAITILLALLGMVLFLYLVTSDGASGVRLRRAALLRGDAMEGESHGSPQEREQPRPSCDTRNRALVVLGGSREPHNGQLSAEAALNYLGWVLRYLRPQTTVPLATVAVA